MSAMVGLGLGAVVGGFIAASGRPESFVLLLVLDAATFFGFAVLLLSLPNPTNPSRPAKSGYREALRDRRLWLLFAVNLTLVSAGVAPMLVLLPAFAKGQAHVPATAIGLIFAVNTTVIVLAQLQVTQLVARRNPVRTLALGSGLWIAAWTLVLGSGFMLRGWTAAAIIAIAMVFYAIGECVYTAVVTPTAASLAPPALRGRYLAVIGFAWQAGFVIGPAGGGFLIDHVPLAFPAVAGAICILATIMLPRAANLLQSETR
jgi:predicted MFS family arabinose efflux permease